MGSNLKFLVVILPFVIGSSIIPGGYYSNSKFREYRGLGNVIKNYSLRVCTGGKYDYLESLHPSGNVIANESCNEVKRKRIARKTSAGKNHCKIKKIVIYDVNDNIGTARLTTNWGVEYLHLIKIENDWSIFSVL